MKNYVLTIFGRYMYWNSEKKSFFEWSEVERGIKLAKTRSNSTEMYRLLHWRQIYTRWQQHKVGLLSVTCQNLNINCKYSNEIFKQPRWNYEEQIQTTNALVESILISQQNLQALTLKSPNPKFLTLTRGLPGQKLM